MTTPLRELLNEHSRRIARRDAETLAQHVLRCDRAWLLAHPEAIVTPQDAQALHRLVARRAREEPLQHLTGVQEFYGRPFEVNRDVLIPRPETELLVEAVLHWIAAHPWPLPPRVLDVGTGSGAIAVSLAAELPSAHIMACDLSAPALAVARRNAARHGVAIRFLLSDLLSDLASGLASGLAEGCVDAQEAQPDQAAAFDVLVSNPPYVARTDAATLDREVVAYEPHLALFAGEDGLDLYRRLIPQAHAHLVEHGLLAMEFGFGQKDRLQALLQAQRSPAGAPAWSPPRFLEDYAGIPRVVLTERL